MCCAPRSMVKCSREERKRRIIEEYGSLPQEFLLSALSEIQQHLGSERYQKVRNFIETHNLDQAIDILLDYYDARYEHARSHKGV
jgi:hypothetical protein